MCSDHLTFSLFCFLDLYLISVEQCFLLHRNMTQPFLFPRTGLGMNHHDLQAQRREMKHKGRNVVWSIAMDKCLIESLAIQAKNGNKIDKCFNENAYTAACIAVNSRFNLNLNNQKVINRLKTIKKRYRVMRDMLSQDGFRWNPNTKMIECDSEDLWKRYITVSMFFIFSSLFFL